MEPTRMTPERPSGQPTAKRWAEIRERIKWTDALSRQVLGGPTDSDFMFVVAQYDDLAAQVAALRAALEALFANPHMDLGDLVYAVRERELQGWDGPAVKQWSDAVKAARAALSQSEPR